MLKEFITVVLSASLAGQSTAWSVPLDVKQTIQQEQVTFKQSGSNEGESEKNLKNHLKIKLADLSDILSQQITELDDTSIQEISENPTIVHEGKVGTADWTLDSNGLLTIGEGECSFKGGFAPWYNYRDEIKAVDGRAAFKASGDLSRTFGSDMWMDDYGSLRSVDLSGWNTEEATKMTAMFGGALNLTELNISSFNTQNVTDMAYMFYNLQKITAIDTSSFDTGKVTNMAHMFKMCYASQIEVSSWDTSSVTDMTEMFKGCKELIRLDTSNWDTSLVTNMKNMFDGCKQLSGLDVSNWNTAAVTDMNRMFNDCSSLSELNVSGWNVGSVTDMSYMFSGCSSLEYLEASNWNPSKVVSTYHMFSYAKNIRYILADNWAMPAVTSMDGMFSGCSSLERIDLSRSSIGSAESMDSLFYDCSSLKELNLDSWNTSSVTSMNSLFEGCDSLNSLSVSSWDTSNVKGMSKLFADCGSLASIDVSNWNTSSATTTGRMFSGCAALTSLDLSGWNTSKVQTMVGMFNGCQNLASLDVSGWNTSSVTDMAGLFKDCSSIAELDLESWQTGNVEIMGTDRTMSVVVYIGGMFENCTSLTAIHGIENFDTRNVICTGDMFKNCSNLSALDLCEWKTPSLICLYGMFDGCSSLTDVNLSGWDLSNLESAKFWLLFDDCSSLRRIDLSNANLSSFRDFHDYGGLSYFPSSLVSISLQNADLSNLTSARGIFGSKLETIDLSGADLSSLADCSNAFYSCGRLQSVNLDNADLSSAVNLNSVFEDCSSLNNLSFENIIINQPENFNSMFSGCSSLETVDVANWDMTAALDLSSMFKNCVNLKELDLSSWNTSSVVRMPELFSGCSSLESMNLSGWDVSSVSCIDNMFSGCSLIKEINLSHWDTSNLSRMNSMFSLCSSLEKLDLSGWDLSHLMENDSDYTSKKVFEGCESLIDLNMKDTLISEESSLSFEWLTNLSKLQIDSSAQRFLSTLPSTVNDKKWYLNGEGPQTFSQICSKVSDLDKADIQREDFKEQVQAEIFRPSEKLVIPGKEPKKTYGANRYELNDEGTLDEEIKNLNILMEQYADAVADAARANERVYPSNKKDPIETKLKKINDASEKKMLTFPAGMPSEAQDIAYSCLADYLEMYKNKGVELKKIDIKADIISISADIIKDIRNQIDDESFKKYYKNGYAAEVEITNFFGASFGTITVTKGFKSYNCAVVSSAKDTGKVLADYINALNGQVKDVTYQGLCSMVDYFEEITGLNQLFKDSVTKFVKDKINIIEAYGFGDILTHIQKIKDTNKLIKSSESILKEKSPYKKAEKLEQLCKDLDAIDYSDSTVRNKAVKSILDKLTSKKQTVRNLLYHEISGDSQTRPKPQTWTDQIYSIFHCPVNVRVYDENDNLIGSIIDEAIEFDSTKIWMDLIGDTKEVVTPKGSDYRIEVEAYDEGSMSAYIEEVTNGEITGRVLYNDVPLQTEQSYFVALDLAENNFALSLDTAPVFTGKNTVVEADKYLSVNEDANFIINGYVNGNGIVSGFNVYPEGDTVTLHAEPREGHQFAGWYLDDVLVSTEAAWTFGALQDVNLEARFESIMSPMPNPYCYQMGEEYATCLIQFLQKENGAIIGKLRTATLENAPESLQLTLHYKGKNGSLISTRNCKSKSKNGLSYQFPIAKIDGAVAVEVFDENEQSVCTIDLINTKTSVKELLSDLITKGDEINSRSAQYDHELIHELNISLDSAKTALENPTDEELSSIYTQLHHCILMMRLIPNQSVLDKIQK